MRKKKLYFLLFFLLICDIGLLILYKSLPIESCSFKYTRRYNTSLLNQNLKLVKNPHNYNYIINTATCDTSNLISLVCIIPHDFDQRKIIRQTWANKENFESIQIVFILGLSLNTTVNKLLIEENKIYNDIIQEDFIDSYDNLTLKTIMGLRWVSNYCSKAKFVLKTDDDVVVNTPVLLKFLKNMNASQLMYMGSYQKNAPVQRTKSKWKVEYEEYEKDCYPPYHQGPAYLITSSLAPILYNLSLYTEFFKLEDIYIGMLASLTEANFLSLKAYYLVDLESSLYYAKKIKPSNNDILFAFTHRNEFKTLWNIFLNLYFIN